MNLINELNFEFDDATKLKCACNELEKFTKSYVKDDLYFTIELLTGNKLLLSCTNGYSFINSFEVFQPILNYKFEQDLYIMMMRSDGILQTTDLYFNYKCPVQRILNLNKDEKKQLLEMMKVLSTLPYNRNNLSIEYLLTLTSNIKLTIIVNFRSMDTLRKSIIDYLEMEKFIKEQIFIKTIQKE